MLDLILCYAVYHEHFMHIDDLVLTSFEATALFQTVHSQMTNNSWSFFKEQFTKHPGCCSYFDVVYWLLDGVAHLIRPMKV